MIKLCSLSHLFPHLSTMDTEIKVSSAKNPEVSKYPFFFLSRIGQDIVSQALHAVGDFEFLISALSVHFTSLVPSLDMK